VQRSSLDNTGSLELIEVGTPDEIDGVFVLPPGASTPDFGTERTPSASSGYGSVTPDAHSLVLQQQAAQAELKVAQLKAEQAAATVRQQEGELRAQREATERLLERERQAAETAREKARVAMAEQQKELQALRDAKRELEVRGRCCYVCL
jgi:hypothetical protein